MEVTTLTAVHVLRYLFALEGVDGVDGPVAATWPVFRRFLELPSQAEEDIGSLQVSFGEKADPRCPQLILARQLTDTAGGYGRHTRATELVYNWELAEPAALDPFELWSSDYPDLKAFCAAVEADPRFALFASMPPEQVTVSEEEAPDEDDAPAGAP
jgi:hypothetical protein